VLITGASSGIGKACAAALAREGWRVFAGVLTAREAISLENEGHKGLMPIVLDVTSDESIANARQTITEALGGAGLDGLVNSAGVAVPGPLELVALADFRRQLEVNAIGPVAVAQAFIPVLRTARGRIVNIGSSLGWVAFPFVGPYSASKAALERITDTLRMELSEWGIGVILVAAGPVATQIWGNSTAAALRASRKVSAEKRALYDWPNSIQRLRVLSMPENQVAPALVVDAIRAALTAATPRATYAVGFQARRQRRMARFMTIGLRDFLTLRSMRKANDE
jgi:NAD(P)-dependent dehydrogenase (short-subunit alcohol dehydrogenase family)